MRSWFTARLGRMRVSTIALIVAFVALFWVQQTFQPEPTAPVAPAPAVVPPGFVPDPNYTWVPRTNVRRPKEPVSTTETTTTAPTTTTTTTTSPSDTATTSPTSPTNSTPSTTVIDPDGPGPLPPQTAMIVTPTSPTTVDVPGLTPTATPPAS